MSQRGAYEKHMFLERDWNGFEGNGFRVEGLSGHGSESTAINGSMTIPPSKQSGESRLNKQERHIQLYLSRLAEKTENLQNSAEVLSHAQAEGGGVRVPPTPLTPYCPTSHRGPTARVRPSINFRPSLSAGSDTCRHSTGREGGGSHRAWYNHGR